MAVGQMPMITGKLTGTGRIMNDPTAKHSLGQHWLRDELALDAMLQAAAVGPDDTVLEIGPGLGTLTEKLVQHAKQVIAVEFDMQLAAQLPARVHAKNLTVTSQDILHYDLRQLPAGYKVVANIPYYLTSNLLRQLCESTNPFSQAALLVQKEVAERVCAAPGASSILTVSVQFYAQVVLGQVVPAYLFTPPPKVDSQILELHHRQQPLFTDVDSKEFFRIVKAGFSQRRKTLVNSLSAGLQVSKQEAMGLLEQAGILPSVRAQTLSLEQWHALSRVIGTDNT
jgi:16S rRNA (adenine1518-N6/adenine1519-N6)-dimethyltransferase